MKAKDALYTLPSGYKHTEVGIIPEDWEVKRLGDVAEMNRGGSPRPIHLYLTDNSDGINWIKIGDVNTFAKYITTTEEKIKKEGVKYSRLVKEGDILLSNSMSYGRPYILKISGCIHDGWLVIQNYFKYINTDYLFYILGFKFTINQYKNLVAGSTVLNLNKELVKQVKIPIPPLDEQQRIADVLSDIDNLIAVLEKLIEKKRQIKIATMHRLLIPKEDWKVMMLGELYDILKGRGLSKDKLNNYGKYECILYGELFTTYKEVINEIKSKTDSFEGTLSKYGDILIPGSTTTTGIDLAKASTLLKNNVLLGGDINILRNKNLKFVNSEFIVYFLNNKRKYEIAKKTKGITIYHLHAIDLIDISISIPPLSEQNRIAGILSDMDAEIEALEKKLEKYQKIKQAIMHLLLTGKVRLTNKKEVNHDQH